MIIPFSDQISAYDDARRGKFSIASFANKYNLGDPVAMNFFYAERPGNRK